MNFELMYKPTFTNQLLALPKNRIPQIIEKIEMLRTDPSPRSDVKKRLSNCRGDVYRLRSGDYRIVYAYGDGWVALLGVDDRKDIYRGDRLVAEGPDVDIAVLPDMSAWADTREEPAGANEWQHRLGNDGGGSVASKVFVAEPLSRRIDEALLGKLRIPLHHLSSLERCETVEELIEADVPEPVRVRLFDVLTAPNFDAVIEQRSLVSGDVSDLLKFAEGELLGFLLRLTPEQGRFAKWAVNGSGPTLLKGGPGTGKSTVALHRAGAMIEALRRAGVAEPRILFTTYTNALVAYSEQLLTRLLGPDSQRVDVRTADSVAMQIVTASDGKPAIVSTSMLHRLLTAAMREIVDPDTAAENIIGRIGADYILEEIGTVIEARDVPSVDAYASLPRPGRRVRLNQTQRHVIWRVYEALRHDLSDKEVQTWHMVRRRAAHLVSSIVAGVERYDGVIVDEAHDLDPSLLRTIVSLSAAPNRIFITADANQSIYGSGFRWADVRDDLRFQGRTGVLKGNHRSTRQIGEAAASYLRGGAIDELAPQLYSRTGPPPTMRAVETPATEVALLCRFLPGAARAFRMGLGACAVLVPTEGAGMALEMRLKENGVQALYMPGRKLDLSSPVVKILTLKSAKGLEFPIVALAGFHGNATLGVPTGGDVDETEEWLLRERRTLFVGMTRAMRALLVVAPGGEWSPLFDGFDPRYWHLQ